MDCSRPIEADAVAECLTCLAQTIKLIEEGRNRTALVDEQVRACRSTIASAWEVLSEAERTLQPRVGHPADSGI